MLFEVLNVETIIILTTNTKVQVVLVDYNESNVIHRMITIIGVTKWSEPTLDSDQTFLCCVNDQKCRKTVYIIC